LARRNAAGFSIFLAAALAHAPCAAQEIEDIVACELTTEESDLIRAAPTEELVQRYGLTTVGCAAKNLEARGRVDDARELLERFVDSTRASEGHASALQARCELGEFFARNAQLDQLKRVWKQLEDERPPCLDLLARHVIAAAGREYRRGETTSSYQIVEIVRAYVGDDFGRSYDQAWLPYLYQKVGREEFAVDLLEQRVAAARSDDVPEVEAAELDLFAEFLETIGRQAEAGERRKEAERLRARR
jgi:hypothetical protein